MISRFLVWKVALRILCPCASHPVSALYAVLDSVRPYFRCVVYCLLHDLTSGASPLWQASTDQNLSIFLIDFEDGHSVVPLFCIHLRGLSSSKRRLDVPCSDGNGGPGGDDDHRRLGFQTNPAFTPELPPASIWRSISFQVRDILFILCWRSTDLFSLSGPAGNTRLPPIWLRGSLRQASRHSIYFKIHELDNGINRSFMHLHSQIESV